MRAFRERQAGPWIPWRSAFARRIALSRLLLASSLVVVVLGCRSVMAQAPPASIPDPNSAASARPASAADLNADALQIAHLLALDPILKKVGELRGTRACGSTATMEELTVREDVVEAIQAVSLDTDSVLAELSNEQSELTEIRAELQSRRDKSVARLNTAALLTGSGLGAVVSATQFTTLGSKTQNTGDAMGIGAGATSTILSLLAAKRQNGPTGAIRNTPNMLAPLLDASPIVSNRYPPAVLRYLNAVPGNGGPGEPTRLDQLRAEWVRAGRLKAGSGQEPSQFAALASSNDPSVKVSISDLANRIAMLGDVRGRVALMKRDLSVLRRMSLGPVECAP